MYNGKHKVNERIESLTLCILMDSPIQIHLMRMGLSITYLKGSQVGMSKK